MIADMSHGQKLDLLIFRIIPIEGDSKWGLLNEINYSYGTQQSYLYLYRVEKGRLFHI